MRSERQGIKTKAPEGQEGSAPGRGVTCCNECIMHGHQLNTREVHWDWDVLQASQSADEVYRREMFLVLPHITAGWLLQV